MYCAGKYRRACGKIPLLCIESNSDDEDRLYSQSIIIIYVVTIFEYELDKHTRAYIRVRGSDYIHQQQLLCITRCVFYMIVCLHNLNAATGCALYYMRCARLKLKVTLIRHSTCAHANRQIFCCQSAQQWPQ